MKKHGSLAPISRIKSDIDKSFLNITIGPTKLNGHTDYKPVMSHIGDEKGELKTPINHSRMSLARSKLSSMRSKRKELTKTQICLGKFVDNNYFVIFMTVLTIFVLFANDIQNAWCRTNVDVPIDIMQCLMFAMFTLEIVLTAIAKEGYIFSFFFWLDVISTISLIQDIAFIFDPLMALSTGGSDSGITYIYIIMF